MQYYKYDTGTGLIIDVRFSADRYADTGNLKIKLIDDDEDYFTTITENIGLSLPIDRIAISKDRVLNKNIIDFLSSLGIISDSEGCNVYLDESSTPVYKLTEYGISFIKSCMK